jgi:hypothetical protein
MSKRAGKRPSGHRLKKASRSLGKHGTVRVESFTKTARGDEVWHLSSNGQLFRLTTSSTSAAIMDDALAIYGPALERLAKR